MSVAVRPTRTASIASRRRTAYHEAGHAVVAHELGWDAYAIAIGPDGSSSHLEQVRAPKPAPEVFAVLMGGIHAQHRIEGDLYGSAAPLAACMTSRLLIDALSRDGHTFTEAALAARWRDAAQLRADHVLTARWACVQRLAVVLVDHRRLSGRRAWDILARRET